MRVSCHVQIFCLSQFSTLLGRYDLYYQLTNLPESEGGDAYPREAPCKCYQLTFTLPNYQRNTLTTHYGQWPSVVSRSVGNRSNLHVTVAS